MNPETETQVLEPNREPSFYEGLLDCVHCGFCLDACPTYQETGSEADSPRGRIYLMRALEEGRHALDRNAVWHLERCVGCQACEPACPSGVRYGRLIEVQRERIRRSSRAEPRRKHLVNLLLWVLTSAKRASLAMGSAGLVGRMTGAGNAVPALFTRFLGGTGPMTLHRPISLKEKRLPYHTPAVGKRRARVGFLSGCVMNALYHDINEKTIAVLAANGIEVIVPRKAGCCGALHAHNGHVAQAARMAKQVIAAFEREDVDAVVLNSAGCGSTMKEYGHLLADDPAWAGRARAFSRKVKDITEFLDVMGLTQPLYPVRERIVYHDACHLAHAQGVRKPPREILRQVPGLEFAPLNENELCCGSAGIYNFLEPELADRLQQRKIDNILAAGVQTVVTGNPGCLSWINDGLARRGEKIETTHTVEVLFRSMTAIPPTQSGAE